MNIRIHGTEQECREAVERLRTVFTLRSVRGPYPDRGESILVRFYVEAEPA